MRVNVTIAQFDNALSVTCARCGHCIEAGGTQLKSLKWALHEMIDACPRGEINYYGPPRYDFAYYGDDPLTESVRRRYEQETGESVPPWPRRPERPPYGLTPESEWEDLDLVTGVAYAP